MAPGMRSLPIPIPSSGPNLTGYCIGETDPVVLARRQKQIDYGKNTDSYRKFVEAVPHKLYRAYNGPWTPNKYEKYSRRSFDQQIKIWKKEVHAWTRNWEEAVEEKASTWTPFPESKKTDENENSSSSELDLCALITDAIQNLNVSSSSSTDTGSATSSQV